jgi:hypothetical protein
MNAATADPTARAFALPEATGLTAPAPPLEGAALNPLPGWMDVLREQLAAVGLGLKREGTVAGACALLFTAFVLWMQGMRGDAAIPLSPVEGVGAALMALLLPMAVWKDEGPARRGYHHAMPVGRGAHAVARGAAGLAWTLAGTVAFFAWMGLLAAITGGDVEAVEAWQWAAPFAGATVLYLLGSALTLASSHPWRWMGAAAVGYVFLGAFRPTDLPRTDVAEAVVSGRYGIFTVLTGLVENRDFLHNLGPVMIPAAAVWLTATFLWLAAAVSLFLFAAYRQPER